MSVQFIQSRIANLDRFKDALQSDSSKSESASAGSSLSASLLSSSAYTFFTAAAARRDGLAAAAAGAAAAAAASTTWRAPESTCHMNCRVGLQDNNGPPCICPHMTYMYIPTRYIIPHQKR